MVLTNLYCVNIIICNQCNLYGLQCFFTKTCLVYTEDDNSVETRTQPEIASTFHKELAINTLN